MRALANTLDSAPVQEWSDHELLHAVTVDGEHAAGEELFRRHHDHALVMAARILGHTPDAEDSVQNAFVTLFRLPECAQVLDVRTYLIGIVTNQCRMHRRSEMRRHARHKLVAREQSNAIEPPLACDDEDTGVFQAIAQLPDRYRLPLQLRYAESMTCKDIAAKLGSNVKTVESRVTRGLALLRRTFYFQLSAAERRHPCRPMGRVRA